VSAGQEGQLQFGLVLGIGGGGKNDDLQLGVASMMTSQSIP
jgi:hypothetical protein